MMIFAKPRFGIALLEEGDLSKHEPSLEEIIAEIKADHNPSVIFLLSSCTPEVMKVDFKGLPTIWQRPRFRCCLSLQAGWSTISPS